MRNVDPIGLAALAAVGAALAGLTLTRPIQAALAGPPFALAALALWYLTRAWRPGLRAASLGLGLGFITLPLVTPQRALPNQRYEEPSSNVLWSSTLQDPGHEVLRFQPVAAGRDHVLLVRYAWHADAPADRSTTPRLRAAINGVPLATLPATPLEGEECCERRWPVPRSLTDGRAIAEIAISQAPRDARLRLIMQGSTSPAALAERGSAFFDGAERRFGVPHSATGTIRRGFAHVWLEPA